MPEPLLSPYVLENFDEWIDEFRTKQHPAVLTLMRVRREALELQKENVALLEVARWAYDHGHELPFLSRDQLKALAKRDDAGGNA